MWRKQIDAINSNRRMNDGRYEYPRMYGDNGWYAFAPQPYAENAVELYALVDARGRRASASATTPWLRLSGRQESRLSRASALRRTWRGSARALPAMRRDTTTPDTRLADDPMEYNPASVHALLASHDGRRASGQSAAIRWSPGCAISTRTSGGRDCPTMWRRWSSG